MKMRWIRMTSSKKTIKCFSKPRSWTCNKLSALSFWMHLPLASAPSSQPPAISEASTDTYLSMVSFKPSQLFSAKLFITSPGKEPTTTIIILTVTTKLIKSTRRSWTQRSHFTAWSSSSGFSSGSGRCAWLVILWRPTKKESNCKRLAERCKLDKRNRRGRSRRNRRSDLCGRIWTAKFHQIFI